MRGSDPDAVAESDFDGPDDNGYYRCLRCAAVVPAKKKYRLQHAAFHAVNG